MEGVGGGARRRPRRVRDPRSGATTRINADWHSLLASLRGVVRLDPTGRHNLFAGLVNSRH